MPLVLSHLQLQMRLRLVHLVSMQYVCTVFTVCVEDCHFLWAVLYDTVCLTIKFDLLKVKVKVSNIYLSDRRSETLQVILLLVMIFLRKRVALTITLFHVAGKVFIHIPLLALQPFWTFLCLVLFWVYWIAVFLFLGAAG